MNIPILSSNPFDTILFLPNSISGWHENVIGDPISSRLSTSSFVSQPISIIRSSIFIFVLSRSS